LAKKDKKEVSSSKVFVAVKYIAFVLFVALSSFISVNLFLHTASDPLDQWIMLTFAVTLELLKVYLLVKANTLMHLNLKGPAWTNYGIYIGSVLVSIIASFAFTLNVLDRSYTEVQASPTAIVIEQTKQQQLVYESDISSYKERIKTLQDQQKSLPAGYTSSFNKLSDQIVSYEAKITEKQDLESKANEEIGKLQLQLIKEKQSSKSTSNVFQLMANTFDGTIFSFIKENTIRLFLLVLISILIELGIVITSPSIKIDKAHLIHFLGEDFSPDKIDEIRKKLYGEENQAPVKKKPPQIVKKKIEEEVVLNELVDEEEHKEESILVEHTEEISEIVAPIVVENHPSETMKPRVKSEKKKYRAGVMTQSQVKSLQRFIEAMFSSNPPLSKESAQQASGISSTYADAFFSWLLTIKGSSGLTLLEKIDSNNGLYSIKANYTKEYILSFMTEEIEENV